MKTILIFIVLLLSAVNSKQEDDGIVSWDENQPLTWNDFKGLPQKTKAGAYTGCGILRSVAKSTGNTASVKIQAVFFCQQSWKKKKDAGASALMHEQKHFDIAECYARKLRKAIRIQKYHSMAELRRKTDSLYTIIDKEVISYQQHYDNQANYGRASKQRHWNIKIKAFLDSLSEYSAPVFIIGF